MDGQRRAVRAALVVVGTVFAMSGAATAELAKVLASDGSAGDWFGGAVAGDGDLVAIGAQRDDEAGTRTGSTYLFDITDPRQPIEASKLLAPDVAMELGSPAEFGCAVAVSGNVVAVGAQIGDGTIIDTGAVYLFDASDPSNPIFLSKVLASDAAEADRFGSSVAIDQSMMIVGAPWNDDNGDRSGSAYIFDISDPSNPIELSKVLAGGASGWFGDEVAIDGSLALVGAWRTSTDDGAAYLFDISDPSLPSLESVFIGATDEDLGRGLDLDGEIALIGAPSNSIDGVASGTVYVYDVSNPAAPQSAPSLTPSSAGELNLFGWSVSLRGRVVVVGAYTYDFNGSRIGSAFMFDLANINDPQELSQLLPYNPNPVLDFGYAVANAGDTAVIGARSTSDNGSFSGAAYLFDAPLSICAGDLDGDGVVGLGDLNLVLLNFGTSSSAGDASGNGSVGLEDLSFVLFFFGGVCQP